MGILSLLRITLLIVSNPINAVVAQDFSTTDAESQLHENANIIDAEAQSSENDQINEAESLLDVNVQISEIDTQRNGDEEEVNAGSNNTVDHDESLIDHLTTLLENRGRAAEVIEMIERLPSDLSIKLSYRVCLARAYVQVGRSEEAEEILLSCVRDFPSSVDVTRLLGSYYLQNQRFDEAEKYFNLTVEMEPVNWKSLAGLGKLFLVRDNDNVKARSYLQEAVRIMPNDENLRFELAMVLFHFDDHMPAKAAIDAAEELNPKIDYKVRDLVHLLHCQVSPFLI